MHYYHATDFCWVIVVFNHAMNVVGQLMLVVDVFDTASMNHVSNTFFGAVLAGERNTATFLTLPIL